MPRAAERSASARHAKCLLDPLGTGILWLRTASRHCHAHLWLKRARSGVRLSCWFPLIPLDSPWCPLIPVDSHGFCWFEGIHVDFNDCTLGKVNPAWVDPWLTRTVRWAQFLCGLAVVWRWGWYGMVQWSTKKTVNIGTSVHCWWLVNYYWDLLSCEGQSCRERVQPREIRSSYKIGILTLRSLYWGRLWRLIAESMGWRKVLRPWWACRMDSVG